MYGTCSICGGPININPEKRKWRNMYFCSMTCLENYLRSLVKPPKVGAKFIVNLFSPTEQGLEFGGKIEYDTGRYYPLNQNSNFMEIYKMLKKIRRKYKH